MRVRNQIAGSVLALFAAAGLASAQVTEKKGLTLEGARKVIAAAQAEAKAKNAPGGVIAVVDDGGNLMALERLDGTFAAGSMISIGKARTAVLFKKPTKVFEDIINKQSFGWTILFHPSPMVLVTSVAVALPATLLAGYWPAMKAIRLSVAESLHYE